MLVWSCIAPHGGELIPELAEENLPRMAATRSAMEELGRRCFKTRPDTILVFTPHGAHVPHYVTVSADENAEGSLSGEAGRSVSARFEIDLELAESLLLRAASDEMPVLPVAYADKNHVLLPFQLDWGAFIPLWFMGAQWKIPPCIVVACPSRSLSREKLIDFGRVAAACCEESASRIALICSADQGHGHDKDGPYGFAPESAEYDNAYNLAVRDGALDRLLDWDEEWIGCAMTDSYWQTLMLHGALLHTPMRPDPLSYEIPTYFGMTCAAFERESEAGSRKPEAGSRKSEAGSRKSEAGSRKNSPPAEDRRGV